MTTTRPSHPPRLWTPLILGGCSLGLYFYLASLRHWGGAQDVTLFLGVMGILFVAYGGALWIWSRRHRSQTATEGRWVLGLALLFRLALIPAGLPGGWSELGNDLRDDELAFQPFLIYDNDVWRYLWDGHVVSSGVNTYRFSPADIEAAYEADQAPLAELLEPPLWQEVHERVSYPTYRTIYPPLTQLVFAASTLLAPGSVVLWKSILLLFDMATCWLLLDLLRRRGRPVWQAAIYAWNPLVVKELVGSAHLDGLMVFCLVLSWWALERRAERLALVALGAAILVKLTPLLLVPLYLRHIPWKRWWILPTLGLVAYAPLWQSIPIMVDSLKAFSSQWVFNPGPWALVRSISHGFGFEGRAAADFVSLAATLATVAMVCWRRPDGWMDLVIGCQWILAIYLLLSPTVMPWYLVWVLPLWALRPGIIWPALTALSLLSYLVYIDGTEHAAWLIVEFGLFTGVVIASTMWRRRPQTPSTTH